MTKSWREATYLVVDTETTGTDPTTDRVVEVAATRVRLTPTLQIDRVLDVLVDPERPIPPTASAIHHLTDTDVAGAPSLETLWHGDLVQGIVEQADVVVAHNAQFDRAFLPKTGLPWICTYRLARHLWPGAPGFSNQVLRYWLKISVDAPNAHRAGDDTAVTAHILSRLGEELPVTVETVSDLVALSDSPIRITTMPFGKHKGTALTRLPRDYVAWALKNLTGDPDLIWSLQHVAAATRPPTASAPQGAAAPSQTPARPMP